MPLPTDDSTPRTGRGTVLPVVLGVAVSAALLWWAVRGLRLEDVLAQVRAARPGPLLLAVALATLTFPLRALRWRSLLRDQDGGPMGAGAAWHATAIGYMANNTLPLRAGEVLRGYAATRLAPVRLSSALASIAVERVFDALTVLGMMTVALFAAGLPADTRIGGLTLPDLARRIGLFAGIAFVAATAVLLQPHAFALLIERVIPFRGLARKLVALLEGVRDGLAALRSPRRLAAVVVWSVVIWLVNALSFLALFPAFRMEVGLAGAILVQSAIVFGIAVPSSPGYVGVFEAAIVLSLALFAIPQDRAFAYAITYHAATFFPIVILGAVSLAKTPLGWRELRR